MKLGILLTQSPYQHQHGDTACHIADAALSKGHEVQLFLYVDGIYNPNRHQALPDNPVLPKDRIAALMARGMRVVV
jgi:sulfur relay (sulfurtransferase) complex TusBCD TusD component (DsrE family)